MGLTLPKFAGPHPALGLLELVRASAGDGPGRVATAGERPLPRRSAAPPSTGERDEVDMEYFLDLTTGLANLEVAAAESANA